MKSEDRTISGRPITPSNVFKEVLERVRAKRAKMDEGAESPFSEDHSGEEV